jgi:2'-5' RNA ligase
VAPATVRLFAALDLPPEARETMAAWARDALTSLPGVRLVRAESLHVTLCFLGGQPAGDVEAIAEAMRVAVGSRPELTLTLGAPTWLPPRRPRVAAVELVDAAGGLSAVQGVVSAALASGGWYEPEGRRFLAHVTLARIGKGGPRRPPELSAPPAVAVTAHSVSLYRSHTGSSGARYEPLATVRLLPADLAAGTGQCS